MASKDQDGTDSIRQDSIRQHVRKVLAQIRALRDQQRAQEKVRQTGSMDSTVEVEVDREDDPSNGIGGVQRPA